MKIFLVHLFYRFSNLNPSVVKMEFFQFLSLSTKMRTFNQLHHIHKLPELRFLVVYNRLNLFVEQYEHNYPVQIIQRHQNSYKILFDFVISQMESNYQISRNESRQVFIKHLQELISYFKIPFILQDLCLLKYHLKFSFETNFLHMSLHLTVQLPILDQNKLHLLNVPYKIRQRTLKLLLKSSLLQMMVNSQAN